MKGLPAGVWLLGFVSLLNDVASEAIYPLLPFFLTTVLGATAVSLGVIEGAADAVVMPMTSVCRRLCGETRHNHHVFLPLRSKSIPEALFPPKDMHHN